MIRFQIKDWKEFITTQILVLPGNNHVIMIKVL
jgi:hypothetical protein